jgi:hypothetical protein
MRRGLCPCGAATPCPTAPTASGPGAAEAEVQALREQAAAAEAYAKHPALVRLRELQALSEVGKNANARIFIGFDKHAELSADTKALMT